jgi:hypothetical protein
MYPSVKRTPTFETRDMATAADTWYIRLPDGRVLRARGTEQLRRFLKSGRIPWDSRVRRSQDAPWQTLVRTQEFADLVPEDSVESEEKAETPRGKPRAAPDLRTLGVRGLVDELCNAFDSSLQHAKLTAAACTGLGMGLTFVIGHGAAQILTRDFHLPAYWAWIAYLATAFVLLVLFNICTSIVTQMTAFELSHFRPAQFREIRAGILGYSVRLTCVLGVVGGLIVGLVILLRLLPEWLVERELFDGPVLETLVNLINGMRLILEVLAWPILALAMLLLGPIYVVEDHSIWGGLKEWFGMLRQHLGRIYIYQAIAFAFAIILTLPLIVPVLLAFGFAGGNPRDLSVGESIPFYLLVGVALTPMLAYLLVAHVFIYLNLRYEFFYSARER